MTNIAAFLTIALTLFLADEGPKSPGTGSSVSYGGNAWSNASNITSSNNGYATVSLGGNQETDELRATNFGFSIPPGATINGIVAEIEKKATANITDSYVFIVKGGTSVGNNYADFNFWDSADAYTTYGGATDLWGTTWTHTDINASDFGVGLVAFNNDFGTEDLSVDHIRITVYYTAGGGGSTANPLLFIGN